MNRQKSIALFAAIAAVAMTAIGLTGVSATTLMVSSVPQSQEGMGMLGHVEYTLMGSDDQVKGYFQSDNIVVDDGKDCVGVRTFGAATAAGACFTDKTFQYIAIGNDTGDGLDGTEQRLDSTGTSICGDSGTGTQEGEMARKLVTPSIITGAVNPAGSVVELEVLNAFTFGINNATTVEQSGIFNGRSTDDSYALYETGAGATTGQCGTPGVEDSNWNMFAIQDLNSGNGITVTDGDSLSVKWTITIGGP